MSKTINTRLLCCWTILCIFGCGSLPDMVMSARYLPTRRSIPTKMERDERLREFFQHILESERDAHLSAASKYANQLQMIQKKSGNKYALADPMDDFDRAQTTDTYTDTKGDISGIDADDKLEQQRIYDTSKPVHFHHHQSWPFGAGTSINRFKQMSTMASDKGNVLQSDISAAHHRKDYSAGDMTSLNGPPRSLNIVRQSSNRANHPLHQQQTATPSDTTTTDLDWMAANNGDVTSMLDYDALYDDVNVNKRSLAMEKFDRYHQSIDSANLPTKSMMQSSNKQRQ